jgi:hypothetical protein
VHVMWVIQAPSRGWRKEPSSIKPHTSHLPSVEQSLCSRDVCDTRILCRATSFATYILTMGLEARMPPLLPDSDAASSAPAQPDTPDLPALTSTPTAYPGCCLALSAPLVAHLASLLAPPPSLTLSIGSGFGLLEAHLLAHDRNTIGVEVAPSPNQYLPASHHRVVHGSRFLEPIAAEATAWLFVYPRRPGLVQQYMTEYGKGGVETVIWAGPKADWEDYVACFGGWGVQERSAEEVGGRAWELIVVATRRSWRWNPPESTGD